MASVENMARPKVNARGISSCLSEDGRLKSIVKSDKNGGLGHARGEET
jgi:hypothetical protein